MDTEKHHEALPDAPANTEQRQTEANTQLDPSSSSLSSKHHPNDSLETDRTMDPSPPPADADPESSKDTPPKPVNPEDTRTKFETAIIMASLCMSVFLAALDITIITTALPTISEHFHSNAGYTWIGSAYLLANAASTPSWGKFSDIWGRKPILLVAAGVFFIGSLIAAVSVNIGMMIVARAIQGIGGGGLIILSNICISDLFSMRNRGAYYGIISMVWAFASGVGPILGGVFTEKVSWRWCFYINLPCTGVVMVILIFFLHLHNPRTPVWEGLKAVDWAGSLTIVGGTLMLLLGLEFGGVSAPWASAKVICLIIFGIVVAGLFVINEWKFARYPIMPLRLFSHSSNLASLGVCFCHGFVFIAGNYYLPLYFQAVLGATPLLSGVYLLPFVLAMSFAGGLTGVFIKKTGKYLPPIYVGLSLTCLGYGLFINLPFSPGWTKIIIYQIIGGLGIGPNFQAPLIALQSCVSPKDIATATGTFGFTRNIGTAISVVVGSVVFQNEMNKRYPSLLAALGPQLANKLNGGSAGANVGVVTALPAAQREVARQAFWQSLRWMWVVYICFAGLGLLISLAIGKNVLSKEHEEVKTGLAEEEKHRKEVAEKRREDKRISRDLERQARMSRDEKRSGGDGDGVKV